MPEDIFRQLQRRLDQYSLGFPATESGIEITILKKLFSQKDAEMFLNMSPGLEEPASVAKRLGMPVRDVAVQLEDMAHRGLLFRLRKGGSARYGAIPFIHGLFEFQVKNLSREMAGLMEQYFEQGLHDAIAGVKGLFLRTVPVGESIVMEPHVAAFDDARAILEKCDTIVVTECICRKTQNIIERGCGKPLDVCFMFGSMARYYLDNNMGRQVTTEEAVSILRKAQNAGLVTQPGTAQNPAGMCNCCGDCCGVLAAIKKFPKPAELVFSNYQALVNDENCTGCGVCIDRCQMDAIAMNDDSVARVDPERCIGCGLCVINCPSEALKLMPKSAAGTRVPPATSAEQMIQIAKNRGVI
jgi:Na+-translocating ferredoxin:NAD+ oxidoreductase subunit B